MSRKSLCTISALAFAIASAFAQPQPAAAPKVVGTVKNVTGLVTRADGDSVSNVAPNSTVAEGQRIVTSSNGSVELDFGDGCTVPMGSSQAIIINTSISCDDRRQSIASVAVAALLGGGSGSLLEPAIFGASQLAGVSLISRPPTGAASGTTGGQGGGIPTPPISGQ